jgi:hypothetical protein
MYQQTVSDAKENIAGIEYLFKNMGRAVKEANGIIIKEISGDRAYIHIACEEDKSAVVKQRLDFQISDIFCNIYKSGHFKKSLKMPIDCLFNFNTLIKTLVAFDQGGDRAVVQKNLKECDPMQEISLDGYFLFRLKELKERWNIIIKLTADNALCLSRSDIFLEFISFMLTTIESKHKTINIIMDEKEEYRLLDGQKNAVAINELLNDKNDDKEENLIASLIYIAPEKVILNFDDGISNKTMNILRVLFELKIKNQRAK